MAENETGSFSPGSDEAEPDPAPEPPGNDSDEPEPPITFSITTDSPLPPAACDVAEPDENFLIRPFNWDGYDACCLLILIFLGVFSRFWIIQYPRHMVSEEEKQIHLINSYLNGSFYLDSEPPLASLILAWFAHFADYNFAYSLPRTETNYSYHDMQYVTMRSTPAFAATIVIPLTFFIVRSFDGSRLAALSAGLFCLFDFLLVALGRNIFVDGYVQLFVTFTVFFTAISSHFQQQSWIWWTFIVLQSVFLGFSISSRLSAAGLWVFVLFWHRKMIPALGLNLAIPIAIFIFSFCLQVALMPLNSQYDGILSDSYRRYLVPSLHHFHLVHSSILGRALELIQLMFTKRSVLSVDFPRWFKWPLMQGHWHVLWTQLGRTVAAFGNIFVWWPILIAIVALLFQIFIAGKIHSDAQLLAIGYMASLLFFVFGLEARGVCGYQIPLLFGLWAMPLFIDTEASEEVSGFLFAAMIALSGFLFILWAPLVYGYENFDTRFLPYFAE
jgi:dolichyl-phosphate-mannose--protein O-mannosyl transferase